MDIILSTHSFTDEPNMLNVTQKVHALFQDSAFDVSKLYQNLDRLTSLLQNKVWVTKLEIRANYSFFLNFFATFAQKNGIANSEFVMKFIDGVALHPTGGVQSIRAYVLSSLTFYLCLGCSNLIAWLYMPMPNSRNQDLDYLQYPKYGYDAAEIEAGFVELSYTTWELRAISTLSRMNCLNHQMTTLDEISKLLRANLIHLPIQGLEFHLKDIHTVIVDVGLLVYSLYDSEEEQETNHALFLDLHKSIQHIKEVVFLVMKEHFNLVPRAPWTRSFQGHYSGCTCTAKNQLQVIQKELERLQPFLKDVAEERYNKHERLQHCAALLNGKAYEVEYIVDASIRKGDTDGVLYIGSSAS
ncbi:hypothetical protein HAX54_012744 [Datura stramonium]|uniref:Late blight resistance protein R1A-like N-terminal domain-containing protein n=1 Tax=Datura stramonium TaxID=4076 RepID=A0ABS8TK85_DATST|nr:hypothetical protein [Datura stramonium]